MRLASFLLASLLVGGPPPAGSAPLGHLPHSVALPLPSVDAQVLRTGQVEGRVVECPSGQPVAGARVMLREHTRGAVTNEDGRFLLFDVPGGTYTLEIRLPDGQREYREPVVVRSGERTRVDLRIGSGP